jgi:hypothetical protein
MLIALRDDVVVKPVYERKIGNLIIPGGSTFGKNSGHGEFQLYDGFIYGIVTSVGKAFKAQTFEGKSLEAGDNILWDRHEGKVWWHEGQEHIILKAKRVQAKIVL